MKQKKRQKNNTSIHKYAKVVALVPHMTEAIIVIDDHLNAIVINPAMKKILGMSRVKSQTLVPLKKIFTENDIDIEKDIRYVLKSGKTRSRKGIQVSTSIYRSMVVPIKDEKKSSTDVCVIMRDMGNRKEVDRIITEFVSVASHQLRTPLTAIKLFAEMLVHEDIGKLNEAQKEYVTNVHQLTVNMIKLVNGILSASNFEFGKFKVRLYLAPIETLIRHVIQGLKPTAEAKQGRITFTKPKTALPSVYIDVNLLNQVLHILIENAIKYSQKGKCKVSVRIEKKNAHYMIKVKDSGIGIPKAAHSRIFEKFFRTENAVKLDGEGTGLGLYVAKTIVEASGGTIGFESQEGKGTTFYFTIPTAVAPKLKKNEE